MRRIRLRACRFGSVRFGCIFVVRYVYYLSLSLYIYTYIYIHIITYIYIYIPEGGGHLHLQEAALLVVRHVRDVGHLSGGNKGTIFYLPDGQTFDPHPHPGGFTKLPECPVASLVVVLGFHWQWGWGSKG